MIRLLDLALIITALSVSYMFITMGTAVIQDILNEHCICLEEYDGR